MITENSKTDKFHIFRLILAGKLDVKNPKKNMALACMFLSCHVRVSE